MIDTNFLDIRFPEDISAKSMGGPEFFTAININRSKEEFRNINWQTPRRKYLVGYDLKNKKQIDELISFFNVCRGRGVIFRYKDWLDYDAKDEKIGRGNGTDVAFQLIKTYAFEQYSVKRKITHPVLNTIQIKVENKSVDFRLDPFGIVSLHSPVKKEEIVTASFEFDIPARFDNDLLSISKQGEQNYSAQELTIVEMSI